MSSITSQGGNPSDPSSQSEFSFGYNASFLSDFSDISDTAIRKTSLKTRRQNSQSQKKNAVPSAVDSDALAQSPAPETRMSSDKSYRDLFGDQHESEPNKYAEPESLKKQKAMKASETPKDENDSALDREVARNEAMRERFKESKTGGKATSKSGGKSYKSLFGSEADLDTANSEFSGGFDVDAYNDSPVSKKKNPNILVGEDQADYVLSQSSIAKPSASMVPRISSTEIEEKKKKGLFVNLPLLWQRVLLLMVLVTGGTYIWQYDVSFVDKSGNDATTNLPKYLWLSITMDGEQYVLQGSRVEERPLIMTRYRMIKLHDFIHTFSTREENKNQDVKLPTTLAELEEEGYITENLIYDGWDIPMRYGNSKGLTTVFSNGPDRLEGTRDDIRYNIEEFHVPQSARVLSEDSE